MRRLYATLIGLQTGLLAACGVNPFVFLHLGGPDTKDPVQRHEIVRRGVVQGLWKHDPEENVDRLTHISLGASEDEARFFAERYQVRVGIDRNPLGFNAVKIVPLPPGYSYSLREVIDDGRTVNVGDIVDIRTEVGRRIIPLVRIVRKCDQPPLPDENEDWQVGCKSYDSFNYDGYAGEIDVMTGW